MNHHQLEVISQISKVQKHFYKCSLHSDLQQPFYRDLGLETKDYPNAELYYKTCLSLPIFPNLSEEMFNKIILEINNF